MTSKKHNNHKPNPPRKKQTLLQEIRKRYFFYLLPIPGILSLILFSYIPMAGIYVAFENYTFQGGLFGSEFVGLKNFRFFFANMSNALRATRNTLVINIGSIVLGTILNVTVAIIMGEINRERYRKAVQTVILFPHFLSWIVVGALSEVLLDTKNGLLNQLIVSLGGEAIEWSYAPQYWWVILIITSLWKGFGYGSVVYYATLTGFDPTLYEAAEVDGASRWKKNPQHYTAAAETHNHYAVPAEYRGHSGRKSGADHGHDQNGSCAVRDHGYYHHFCIPLHHIQHQLLHVLGDWTVPVGLRLPAGIKLKPAGQKD